MLNFKVTGYFCHIIIVLQTCHFLVICFCLFVLHRICLSQAVLFLLLMLLTVLLFFFNGNSFSWCFHFINAPMVVLFWSLIYSLCFEISSSHFIVLSSCLWVFILLNLCSFSVQLLSRVQLFVTPWTAAHQASLSITAPGVYPNSRPLSQWCHPTISSSVVPFSSRFNLSQHQGLFT